ncbi:hypothetical protein CLAN_1510 [Campylobacter lanienae NCTC 13004]|uniref:Uncharacterized protein n=1 Tax=Campylobacter lanienae NCTC 13004 TaxID=1031753 RepID=A0A1X9SPX2_9BACT|nr:hypothetical protein CLAN_1510 [Campylobacter lanienae NCTC 13004]
MFEKFGAKRRFILLMSRLTIVIKALGVDENFGIKDKFQKDKFKEIRCHYR